MAGIKVYSRSINVLEEAALLTANSLPLPSITGSLKALRRLPSTIRMLVHPGQMVDRLGQGLARRWMMIP
jgi:hypothetical protein